VLNGKHYKHNAQYRASCKSAQLKKQDFADKCKSSWDSEEKPEHLMEVIAQSIIQVSINSIGMLDEKDTICLPNENW